MSYSHYQSNLRYQKLESTQVFLKDHAQLVFKELIEAHPFPQFEQ